MCSTCSKYSISAERALSPALLAQKALPALCSTCLKSSTCSKYSISSERALSLALLAQRALPAQSTLSALPDQCVLPAAQRALPAQSVSISCEPVTFKFRSDYLTGGRSYSVVII